ncbi:MAG: permease [Actinobacteria bacterium RBG_13_35_12]|nr:MAG: permease [Actinobacteria bacterium RBG_13_35_12]
MFNGFLYIVCIVFLIISFLKSREKTKKALIKAWKSFENILPLLLGIIFIVGILIAVLNAQVISKLIGSNSGFLGVAISSTVGAITLIPGFIAFPTAALLLENGAGYMQIAAFISSLMMVGIVTLPMEFKYFGKKISIVRNILAFLFSFLVAFAISKVMEL